MMSQLLLLGNWFTNIFKNLTFLLDKGIYSLVQSAYAVFYYLADARLLDDAMVRNVTNRIYTLLGIVMVFVLAFNLLNYIVDPDKINDKKIGASAFIKDVIISLAVIALTPLLFNKLYALQGQILSSGVIANLILGGQSSANAQYDTTKYKSLTDFYIQNGANTMVASVYVAFLYPEDGFTALDCHSDTADQEKLTKHQAYCDAYDKAGSGGGINAFSDFITNDDYNYTPLLTTVAGIVLLFFMISFCINLAKRVGKLAILQFLAPIPMALELVPSKKGLRKNWFDTLIKVYLEVFFFLGVMYIIIFLISLVPSVVEKIFEAGGDGLSLTKLITVVLLMYGLLMFGKEAPQMVFDLLGIKSTGVIGEAAKRALAMGAVTANTVGAATGNLIRGAAQNKGAGRIGGAILGAGSATVRNLWEGRNVHSLQDARRNRLQINQGISQRRANRQSYNAAHGGFIGGIEGHVRDFGSDVREDLRSFATGDRFSADNAELAALERLSKATSAAKINKNADTEYAGYRSRFDSAKNRTFYQDLANYQSTHAGATEEDFINALKTGSAGAHLVNKHAALIHAAQGMEQREAKLKADNEGKLKIAAQEAKAIMAANPKLKELRYGSPDDFMSRLNSVIDDNGNLQTGKTAADLQSVIDDYNKAIKNKQNEIQIRSAQDRIRDEQRQARRNNSGGDKK